MYTLKVKKKIKLNRIWEREKPSSPFRTSQTVHKSIGKKGSRILGGVMWSAMERERQKGYHSCFQGNLVGARSSPSHEIASLSSAFLLEVE